MTKKAVAKKKPFYEVVAERLIEQLKAGTAPWQRPWDPGVVGASMPFNVISGNRYRGINAVHLMAAGFGDLRWMTYKQAEALGAQVKKGATGTTIQYWKFNEQQDKLDDNGKPIRDENGKKVKETVQLKVPRVFYATVFNAHQVDGLAPLPEVEVEDKDKNIWEAIGRAEEILTASGANIVHLPQPKAFYRVATDSIVMPEKEQFETAAGYYATALHELGHWTGHRSRLDRDLTGRFGTPLYAKEELRAEIASMILGDTLGIGHDPEQHAAYVASWIKVLQDDPMEIMRASSDAEKIHKFVMSFAPENDLTEVAEEETSSRPAMAM